MRHQLDTFLALWFIFKKLKFYMYIVKMIHKDIIYKNLLMINRLEINKDMRDIIRMEYKFSVLEKKYKLNYDNMITHLKYYIFINKKINKKHNRKDTLLKSIKFFDC